MLSDNIKQNLSDNTSDSFDAKLDVRMFSAEKTELERLARENPSVWESAGHVVRAAIVKFLRDYKEKENKI